MKYKRLTVRVEGREALPVRAIPYVSGWTLSPDDVAMNLARKAGAPFAQLRNISAYHQHSGSSVEVLPKEWDAVVAKLAALAGKLRAKFQGDDRGYAAWRDKAASKLPAGVFVWFDEFEHEFRDDFSDERITYVDERPGERDLVLSPMLTDGIREVVLEGFDIDVDDAPNESEAQDSVSGQNASTALAIEVVDDVIEPIILPATRATDVSGWTRAVPGLNANGVWQEEARRIATDFDTADASAEGNLYDSVTHMAERVAKSMRDNGIYGPNGPLGAGTVLRDALSGAKWNKKRRGETK